MLEVLQFIFSSFWVWLGTLVFLVVIATALEGMAASVFKREGAAAIAFRRWRRD